MFKNFLAAARNFFYRKYWRNFKKFMESSRLSYFFAYHKTFGIFLTRAGISEQVLAGSISSNV